MEEEMKMPVEKQEQEMEVEMTPEMVQILAKHFGVEVAELGNYILTQLMQEGEKPEPAMAVEEEEKIARSMFPSLNQ